MTVVIIFLDEEDYFVNNEVLYDFIKKEEIWRDLKKNHKDRIIFEVDVKIEKNHSYKKDQVYFNEKEVIDEMKERNKKNY